MNDTINEIKDFISEKNEMENSSFALFYEETSDHFSLIATIEDIFLIKDALIFQNNNLSYTVRLQDSDKIGMIKDGFEISTDNHYIKLKLQ